MALALAGLILFCGCSLTYTVKDPVLSSIQYDRKEAASRTLTIVDQRTGDDSEFLKKIIGVGGAGSKMLTLKIKNMEDPLEYFAAHLEKELVGRGIPVKCTVGKPASTGLLLEVQKYQIVNIRATGFSPWEACHIFQATLTNNGVKKPIKAYFYNGRTPWWSMDEIEEPCFTIPVSILIKDVASKINSAAFYGSVSKDKINTLEKEINADLEKNPQDPYQLPFWKVLELGYTNNPDAMESLKKYSLHQDEFFKSCAVSSIGTLGAEGQLEFLIGIYKGGHYNDKYMAAKSIGDVGTPDAIKFLNSLKKEDAYAKEGGLKNCVDLYAP